MCTHDQMLVTLRSGAEGDCTPKVQLPSYSLSGVLLMEHKTAYIVANHDDYNYNALATLELEISPTHALNSAKSAWLICMYVHPSSAILDLSQVLSALFINITYGAYTCTY